MPSNLLWILPLCPLQLIPLAFSRWQPQRLSCICQRQKPGWQLPLRASGHYGRRHPHLPPWTWLLPAVLQSECRVENTGGCSKDQQFFYSHRPHLFMWNKVRALCKTRVNLLSMRRLKLVMRSFARIVPQNHCCLGGRYIYRVSSML